MVMKRTAATPTPTIQTHCANGWIHRRFNRRKEEIQCPMCGTKLAVWSDERHEDIEAEHKQHCGVINRKSPADEVRYG